jgi:hypothetical protein
VVVAVHLLGLLLAQVVLAVVALVVLEPQEHLELQTQVVVVAAVV